MARRTWGGRRKGAGRKPKGKRAGVRHALRPDMSGREPAHVTIKVSKHVWNLRSKRSMRVVDRAFFVCKDRFGVRITHFSVQGNHIHIIAEAPDRQSLSRAIQGLSVRLARGLNRMMGRTGKVFADRFHVHVLRTISEVRNAVRYVMQNARIHAKRLGLEFLEPRDRFAAGPGTEIPPAGQRPLVVPPRTWLLRICPTPPS